MASAVDTLLHEGYGARREGKRLDAKRLFVEALDLSRTTEDQDATAQALTGLGRIERDLGNGDIALKCYEEAAEIYRFRQNVLQFAHTIRHVGDIHYEAHHFDLAELQFREALAIYRAHPETPPLDLANAIRGYALLKGATGDIQQARTLWREAGNLYAQLDVQAGVEESQRKLTALNALG